MENKALTSIMKHAYNTVPYYKKLFDTLKIDPETIKTKEDLLRIPILKKDDIQEHPGIFVSSNCLSYPNSEQLIQLHTSGSTGKILNIYWTRPDYIKSLFSLWLFRNRYFSITPQSKYCTFHSAMQNGFEIQSPKYKIDKYSRQLSLSRITGDKESLFECYQKMMDFQPVWILSQPSMMYLISKFILENKLEVPKSLKYIELTGEYLFDTYKNMIKKVLKIPVINMYGSIESNGIAVECPNGNLHCISDNVIVEILKNGKPVPEGEQGEIHITCLTNKAMPFIRYALGDRGSMHNLKTCDCGLKDPVINILAGRIGHNIYLKNNVQINSFVLNYIIESLNSKMEDIIRQFQVIQESIDSFTVKLAIKDKDSIIKETLMQSFIKTAENSGFQNLNWDFQFYNSILPHKDTNKLQFFINKLITKDIA